MSTMMTAIRDRCFPRMSRNARSSPVHEIAPVGQPGEGIVEKRMRESFLQIHPLLHFGRELLIYGAQTTARRYQGGARALQRMTQVVGAKRK